MDAEPREPVCPGAERVSELLGEEYVDMSVDKGQCFYYEKALQDEGSGVSVTLEFSDPTYRWETLLLTDPAGDGRFEGEFSGADVYLAPQAGDIAGRPAFIAQGDESVGSGCRILAEANDGSVLSIAAESFSTRDVPADPDCAATRTLAEDYAGPYAGADAITGSGTDPGTGSSTEPSDLTSDPSEYVDVTAQLASQGFDKQLTTVATAAAYTLYPEPIDYGNKPVCAYWLFSSDYLGDHAAYSDYPIEGAEAPVRVELWGIGNGRSFGSVEASLDEVTPDFLTSAPGFDRSSC